MKKLLLSMVALVAVAPCFAAGDKPAVVRNKSDAKIVFTAHDGQRTKELAKDQRHECKMGGSITNTSDKDLHVTSYKKGNKKDKTKEVLAAGATRKVVAGETVTVKPMDAEKSVKKSEKKTEKGMYGRVKTTHEVREARRGTKKSEKKPAVKAEKKTEEGLYGRVKTTHEAREARREAKKSGKITEPVTIAN